MIGIHSHSCSLESHHLSKKYARSDPRGECGLLELWRLWTGSCGLLILKVFSLPGLVTMNPALTEASKLFCVHDEVAAVGAH